jgi:hypothetical protein
MGKIKDLLEQGYTSVPVEEFRDCEPGKKVVWVLYHPANGGAIPVGVTSDWKVKERWEDLDRYWEAYFLDDPEFMETIDRELAKAKVASTS